VRRETTLLKRFFCAELVPQEAAVSLQADSKKLAICAILFVNVAFLHVKVAKSACFNLFAAASRV
jgi:hypothetical protein